MTLGAKLARFIVTERGSEADSVGRLTDGHADRGYAWTFASVRLTSNGR
jgi:hypothetical protein